MNGLEVLNTKLGAIVVRLINEANKHIPGADGKEKEAWVVDRIEGIIEKTDEMLPMIGRYMDLPLFETLANPLRRLFLSSMVHRIFAYATFQGMVKTVQAGADIPDEPKKIQIKSESAPSNEPKTNPEEEGKQESGKSLDDLKDVVKNATQKAQAIDPNKKD